MAHCSEENILSRAIDFFILALEQEKEPIHHLKLIKRLIQNAEKDLAAYFSNLNCSEAYKFFADNFKCFNIVQGYVSLKSGIKSCSNNVQQNSGDIVSSVDGTEQLVISELKKTLINQGPLHYEYLIKCLETAEPKAPHHNFFASSAGSERFWFFRNRPDVFSITSNGDVSVVSENNFSDVVSDEKCAVIELMKKHIQTCGPVHFTKLVQIVQDSGQDFSNYFSKLTASDRFWFFDEAEHFCIENNGYVSLSRLRMSTSPDIELQVLDILVNSLKSSSPVHYYHLTKHLQEHEIETFNTFFSQYNVSEKFWFFKKHTLFSISGDGFVSLAVNTECSDDIRKAVSVKLQTLLEKSSPMHYSLLIENLESSSEPTINTFFRYYSDAESFDFFKVDCNFTITEQGYVSLQKEFVKPEVTSSPGNVNYLEEETIDFFTNCLTNHGPMDYIKLFNCLECAPSETSKCLLELSPEEKFDFFLESDVFELQPNHVVTLKFQPQPFSNLKGSSNQSTTEPKKLALDILTNYLKKNGATHFEKLFNILESNNSTRDYAMNWSTVSDRYRYFKERGTNFFIDSASYVSIAEKSSNTILPVSMNKSTSQSSFTSLTKEKTKSQKHPKYGHNALSQYFSKKLGNGSSFHYRELFVKAAKVSDHFSSVIQNMEDSQRFRFFRENCAKFNISNGGYVTLTSSYAKTLSSQPTSAKKTNTKLKVVQPSIQDRSIIPGTHEIATSVTPEPHAERKTFVTSNSKSKEPFSSAFSEASLAKPLISSNLSMVSNGTAKSSSVPSTQSNVNSLSNSEQSIGKVIMQTQVPTFNSCLPAEVNPVVDKSTNKWRNSIVQSKVQFESIMGSNSPVSNENQAIVVQPNRHDFCLNRSSDELLQLSRDNQDHNGFCLETPIQHSNASSETDSPDETSSRSSSTESMTQSSKDPMVEDRLIAFFVDVLESASELHYDELFWILDDDSPDDLPRCFMSYAPSEREKFFRRHDNHFSINSHGFVSVAPTSTSKSTTSFPLLKELPVGENVSGIATVGITPDLDDESLDISPLLVCGEVLKEQLQPVVAVKSIRPNHECLSDVHLSVLESSIAILKERIFLSSSELVDVLRLENDQMKEFFQFFVLHDVIEFFHVHSLLFTMDSDYVLILKEPNISTYDAVTSHVITGIIGMIELQAAAFFIDVMSLSKKNEPFDQFQLACFLVYAPGYIISHFSHKYSDVSLIDFFKKYPEYFQCSDDAHVVLNSGLDMPKPFLLDANFSKRLTLHERCQRFEYIKVKVLKEKEIGENQYTPSKSVNNVIESEQIQLVHQESHSTMKSTEHSTSPCSLTTDIPPANFHQLDSANSLPSGQHSHIPVSDKTLCIQSSVTLSDDDIDRIAKRLSFLANKDLCQALSSSFVSSRSDPKTTLNMDPNLKSDLQHISRFFNMRLDRKAVDYFTEILRKSANPLPISVLECCAADAPSDVRAYLRTVLDGRDFSLFFYLHLEEFAIDSGDFVNLRMREILLSREKDFNFSDGKHNLKDKEEKVCQFFKVLINRYDGALVPLADLERDLWLASVEIQEYLAVNYYRNLRLFFEKNPLFFHIDDADLVSQQPS